MIGLFAALLAVHGLVHLMGPAKAFRYAELPGLTQSISPSMGIVWLLAAVLMLVTAVALLAWPRGWWLIGATALVVSQSAIAGSWTDAKFGTVANVVLAAGVVFGFLTYGPGSLRARYEADVNQRVTHVAVMPPLRDEDLRGLPTPVARYVRLSGAIGQPRVRNVRARMHGRIRGGPSDPWMPFTVEQYNFFDVPSRFFYMNASRMLVPIQGFHRFAGSAATMTVKLAALLPVAQASGPDMTQAETVTLFNDMCLLAPATLVDPAIVWEAIDERRTRARFTHAGVSITADLFFNDRGELVDFVSDDRRQVSADGATMRPMRWSTPMSGYRAFGQHQLVSHGEGRWHDPSGTFSYIELDIDDVAFNVTMR